MAEQSYKTSQAYVDEALKNNTSVMSRNLEDMVNESSIPIKDYFKKWKQSQIDETRWNGLFPYQIMIAETRQDADEFTGAASAYYLPKSTFILPIPPEALTIQTPYAIQISRTMGGYQEEHAGAPFKMIMAQGTFGVNLNRSTIIPTSETLVPNIGIYSGTINAAVQTAQTASNILPGSKNTQQNNAEADYKGTGYYQWRLLEMFLESYARLKTGPTGRKYRLLFVRYKDQMAHVVTPMMFNVQRSASNPHEYLYQLQFKSWNTVRSESLSSNFTENFQYTYKPSMLYQVLNTLTRAQQTILGAISVVNAVQADVAQVLEIARQTMLAVKLQVAAAQTVMDLPQRLIQDYQDIVVDSWESLGAQIAGPGGPMEKLRNTAAKQLSAKQSSRSYQAPLTGVTKLNQPAPDIDPSVLDEVFKSPYLAGAWQFLQAIPLQLLNTPPKLSKAVQAEYSRVSKFDAADYAAMRDQLTALIASISDTMGASDAQYDDTYQNVHPTVDRTPNLDDFSVLFALNDALDALNKLATQPKQISDPTMDYVAGFASQSGIAFQKPVSKYAVPFPYDFTLERLAMLYLGNPDRWLEIAILNGLREPYVDEVGFDRYLTANGSLSTITISDASDLRIGQPVWIQSNYVCREKRHILNIQEVSSSVYVLTLDGAADLDKYRINSAAYMHAFLPDTVNSHQLIYIPSDIQVPDNSDLAKIPGVDVFDDLLEIGGVDILITSDNDIAVTPDGDCRLAQGLAAITQTAKVALGTPKGSLLRHPSFGLPLVAGQSIADLDINDLAESCRNLFSNDPMFQGVTNVAIQQTGPTVNINLSLVVTGQDLPISLALQVKR